MASTGIINGTLLRISVGGDAVGHSTNCSLEVTAETRSILTKDLTGGWTSAKPGQKSWTGQVTGLFAEDAPGEKFKDLFTALSAGTEIAFEMSTDVTGDYKYTGTALVTSISLGAPVEGNVTYDVTFTGISELAQAVIS